jgi:multimeric flavodoxin WrbA
MLDLSNFPLPISPSGTTIPAKLALPLEENPYEDEEVNVWSRTMRGFDAYIFLTPQYNWSFPGSLKVVLDHLFHEWSGKPMMVISYGGHGGGKGSAHLKEVWKGLRGGECVGGGSWRWGVGRGWGGRRERGFWMRLLKARGRRRGRVKRLWRDGRDYVRLWGRRGRSDGWRPFSTH